MNILKWAARITGALVLLVIIIAIIQVVWGNRNFELNYQNIALYAGLLVGLMLAYKWPLLGGSLATLGILISMFIHPLVIIPGILFVIYGVIRLKK